MSQSGVPLMDLLARRMEWLSVRQRVIAQNVANADTPGYVAKDLKEPSFAELLRTQNGPRLAMAQTSAGHAGGLQGVTGSTGSVTTEKGYEVTPTGNAVQLEDEMMKLSETQMEHDTVSNLYHKNVSMLRLALGISR